MGVTDRLRRWRSRWLRPLDLGVCAMVLTPAADGTDDGDDNRDGHIGTGTPPDRHPGPRRVLLVRHSYTAGWHLPGGGVDRGESAGAAVRRELREETGLIAESPVRLLGLYGRFPAGINGHVALYLVEHWQGRLVVDGREIVAAAFFPVNQLPDTLSAPVRRRIQELITDSPPNDLW